MTEMTQEYRDAIIRRLVGLPMERDQKDERDPRDTDNQPTPEGDGETAEVTVSGENLAEPLQVRVQVPNIKQGKKRS